MNISSLMAFPLPLQNNSNFLASYAKLFTIWPQFPFQLHPPHSYSHSHTLSVRLLCSLPEISFLCMSVCITSSFIPRTSLIIQALGELQCPSTMFQYCSKCSAICLLICITGSYVEDKFQVSKSFVLFIFSLQFGTRQERMNVQQQTNQKRYIKLSINTNLPS